MDKNNCVKKEIMLIEYLNNNNLLEINKRIVSNEKINVEDLSLLLVSIMLTDEVIEKIRQK